MSLENLGIPAIYILIDISEIYAFISKKQKQEISERGLLRRRN